MAAEGEQFTVRDRVKNYEQNVKRQQAGKILDQSDRNYVDRTAKIGQFRRLSREEVGELEQNLVDLGVDVEKVEELGSLKIKKLIEDEGQNQIENEDVQKITIVLLGKSGQGKSNTGNTLIGVKNTFLTAISPKSVTKETSSATTLVEIDSLPKLFLNVIDTPGLFDQPKENQRLRMAREYYEDADEENQDRFKTEFEKARDEARQERDRFLYEEVTKCIELSPDGINAFFFIMDSGRFDEASQKTIDAIKEYFGAKRMFFYLFLVMAEADKLAACNKTEDDYKNDLEETTETLDRL